MLNIFKKFTNVNIETVQLEISSHCNASCSYCPHHIYKKNIKRNFFKKEAIENIIKDLNINTYIHLQGWGEPFLHPDFFEIAEKIKKSGFKTGTTTNAILLDDEHLEKIVELKIDYLALSTAGSTIQENDLTRKKTSLANIREIIFKLKDIKKRKNSSKPKIHIANILLRSHLNNFFSSDLFYNSIKPDQVVVSSLSLACSENMEKEIFLSDSQNSFEITAARFTCFRKKNETDIHYHIVSPFFLTEKCSENIEKTPFIGSDGNVHPCVFLGIPLKKKAEIFIRGTKREISPLSFGNIYDQPLKKIWKSKNYRRFRKKGLKENPVCRLCYKRSIEYAREEENDMKIDNYDARWQIIRDANKEKKDKERLRDELAKL